MSFLSFAPVAWSSSSAFICVILRTKAPRLRFAAPRSPGTGSGLVRRDAIPRLRSEVLGRRFPTFLDRPPHHHIREHRRCRDCRPATVGLKPPLNNPAAINAKGEYHERPAPWPAGYAGQIGMIQHPRVPRGVWRGPSGCRNTCPLEHASAERSTPRPRGGKKPRPRAFREPADPATERRLPGLTGLLARQPVAPLRLPRPPLNPYLSS